MYSVKDRTESLTLSISCWLLERYLQPQHILLKLTPTNFGPMLRTKRY